MRKRSQVLAEPWSPELEKEIAQNPELLLALVDAAPVAMFCADEFGTILLANSKLETTFGYGRGELLRKAVGLLIPEAHQRITNPREPEAVPEPFSSPSQVTAFRKDGTRFRIQLRLAILATPQGNYGAGFLDPVEFRSAYASTATPTLDSRVLARGMAHALNNMLTPMLSCCQMLLRELPKNHRLYSLVEHADAIASSGADFTRQLQVLGGSLQGTNVVTNVHELLNLSRPGFARILGPRVNLVLRLDAENDLVSVARGSLAQAFENLVNNARDAMPAGGTLDIETHNFAWDESSLGALPGLKPGLYLRVAFADTGHGIPPDQVARIFEPFFTTRKGAHGLGLTVVQRIARDAGGEIFVYSGDGYGSAFHLYLPVLK